MAQRSLQVAVGLLFFQGRPFVVQLFTTGQTDFHFGLAIVYKVYLEGDKRNPLFVQFADQLTYFPLVEQQLAHPKRIGYRMGGKGIGRDVHIVEIDLAILEPGIAIFNIGSAGPQRFYLRTSEDDPGLHGLIDMIIMECFFIFADNFHDEQK